MNTEVELETGEVTISKFSSVDGAVSKHPVLGYYIPGTNRLIHTDRRWQFPERWCLNHVPTGYSPIPSDLDSRLHCRDVAIAVGQAFYREAVAAGMDLTVSDPKVFAAFFKGDEAARAAFFERVFAKL